MLLAKAQHGSCYRLLQPILYLLLALAMAHSAEGRVWTKRAEMLAPRGFLGASVVDGKIYAVGGSFGGQSDPSATVLEVYDPATDSWSQKADLPVPRSTAIASTLDGKIYVVGGRRFDTSGPELLAYDPASDSWSQKATMPLERRHQGAAVVEGKLYVIGGGVGSTLAAGSPSVLMYDPATDSWSQKADMPKSAIWLMDGASVVDGKIYVMGLLEHTNNAILPTVLMYDPATDSWSQKADMPTTRVTLATAVVDGKIYAIGGGSRVGDNGKAVVEVYDPTTDTWTTEGVVELQIPRAGGVAAPVDGKIFLFGGWSPTGALIAPVKAFDPTHPLVRNAPEVYATAGQTSASLPFEIHLEISPGDPTPDLRLDLSAFGQTAPVDLSHQGGGRYTGQGPVEVPAQNGHYELPLWLLPTDAAPEPFFDLQLVVFPTEEHTLLADGLTDEWIEANAFFAAFDPQATAEVFGGQTSLRLQTNGTNKIAYLIWEPAEPVDGSGYRLHFAFFPEELEESGDPAAFNVIVKSQSPLNAASQEIVPLLDGDGARPGVDLQQSAWQIVEIPLGQGSLLSITFEGNIQGTFYLDDVRLVPGEPPPPPVTAVLEEHQSTAPDNFALDQNYPNPFNSGTVIRFALPQPQEVELAIYNLAGQKVATLIEGQRVAGTYTVAWDGRDAQERDLASGVYLYKLQAGSQVETRKLLLMR